MATDLQTPAQELVALPVPKTSKEMGKLQQFVFTKWQEAKAFRRGFDMPWDRWFRRYVGHHWDTPRPAWKSSPVVNFIFSTIETIIPIMTDNRPQITVVSRDRDSVDIGEILGNINTRVWVDNRMDAKLPEILKTTLTIGTSFAKVWWNPALAEGKGDIAVSVIDPRNIYPSPGAKSMDDANYVVFAANLPLRTVEKMFPKSEGKIPTGIWDQDLMVDKNTGPLDISSFGSVGPIQTTDGTRSSWPLDSFHGRQMMRRDKLVTMVELWFKDDNDQANVIIMANGVLLKGPIIPFAHNKFPFIPFIDYTMPSSFWGMGEVQQLEPVQLNINARRGQLTDILRLTGNPIIVVDADAGVDPKALRAKPGLVVLKNRGSEMKWLQPPQMPSGLFDIQTLDKQDFDGISGIFDVTQGRRPVGIEAASAIVELQEAAQTRIRLKTRNMEGSLRMMGEQVTALAQQFYTKERTIRIVGGRSTQPEFTTFNIDEPDEDGGFNRINDITVGKFDVEIGVGSTLPISKTRRFAQMVQLLQLGVVDAQAVLENSGMSPEEVEVILTRVREQQEALAGQQDGGVPPGSEGGPQAEPVSQIEEQSARTQLGV